CPSGLHWDRKRNICNNPSEAKCPNWFKCIEGTTKPHQCECNLYYKCINNDFVLQKCPNGLDWDRKNNACRDPKDAGCRPVCKDGPYKPHEKDCDKYYKCENGNYVPKTCPSGLHWDRQRNTCSNPSEAKCPYPPPPCTEGSTHPHECQCRLYYKCKNGGLTLQECEVGKEWDRINHICTDPASANCPKRHPFGCNEGSYKSDDKECNIYYKCISNNYVSKTCTPGLHWNRKRNLCTDPIDARCPTSPINPCLGGFYKPHEKKCDKYYKCENGDYVLKTCPSGLHWNRKRNLCIVPADARCPTSPINTCLGGFYKPHEKECDKYYTCENGDYVLKTCPSGLHWNRKRNLCIVPADARCPTSPINTCLGGFYKPHEKECDKYYTCENGDYVLKTCPSGLHWSRKRNLCIVPEDARCPTSPINPCPEGFYKPHEKECDKYFKCENNNYVTKTCISGLHWNRKHNLCTDPEKANCLILRSESTCVQGSTKHHECECSFYHVCMYDQWILQVCPKGLNWDENAIFVLIQIALDRVQQVRNIHLESKHENLHGFLSYKVCVEPENTNSKATNEENIPEVSITDNLLSEKVPQSSRPVYISPNIPGVPDHCPPDDYGKLVHLPHETNCSLFYKCNKGEKILQRCPPGLHYNPVMQICLTPEQSKCTSKPENKVNGNRHLSDIKQSFRTASKSSRPVYISPNIPGVPDHCPPDDYGKLVHLPHETNCSLFYKCNKGEKILQRCPPGLHYNPVMQICLTPEQSKCTSKPENKLDGNQYVSEIEGLNTAISESSTPAGHSFLT
ncbi:LOW QUALITY PROTEIN: uncharacterized protein LOC122634992, partial [Vespula pensylvanica]|uniref:LOW QUALITY PROTEIN: uncharacterized protein LOC122634992 n=1 Tax=Vespula pensylvanica TaxID=30213 RepID=UPI001CBA0A52